jgi:hypothetical protein
MATLQPYPKTKPWCAKRKRDGIEHYLGHYATKEEAEAREATFDQHWPSQRGTGMLMWRNQYSSGWL